MPMLESARADLQQKLSRAEEWRGQVEKTSEKALVEFQREQREKEREIARLKEELKRKEDTHSSKRRETDEVRSEELSEGEIPGKPEGSAPQMYSNADQLAGTTGDYTLLPTEVEPLVKVNSWLHALELSTAPQDDDFFSAVLYAKAEVQCDALEFVLEAEPFSDLAQPEMDPSSSSSRAYTSEQPHEPVPITNALDSNDDLTAAERQGREYGTGGLPPSSG